MVYNQHIGMYTIDRPMNTCIFASNFCRRTCYNNKLYKSMFRETMLQRDKYNALFWDNLDGPYLYLLLKNKRIRGKRVRFCTRGEPITCYDDILKIEDILRYNPNTLFWLPTRAHNRKEYKKFIEDILFQYDNIRIQASIDIETNKDHIEVLKKDRWSTMFYGDNDDIQGRVLCPKTWLYNRVTKYHGYCRECSICFNNDMKRPVHLHLRQH